ncbi:Heptaprenyl diphosphate synthase component 2 [bacterium HR34]|nr:Heptaprenyl diphosphate synthase component 2 [bacterium HR34]
MKNLSKEEFFNASLKDKDFKELNDFLAYTKKVVYPKIKVLLNRNIDKKLKDCIEYQIAKPGKMLRPALMLLFYKAYGGKSIDKVSYLAAAVEIMHNSLLITDDIIDDTKIRRGRLSTWQKFSSSIAQCIPFIYTASVYEAVLNVDKIFYRDIINYFSNALKEVTIGEMYDIFCSLNKKDGRYLEKNKIKNITIKDYYKIAKLKTGSLFALPCGIGTLLAKASKKEVNNAFKWGYDFGVLFQITDDILDMQPNKKGELEDVKDGKVNNFLIINCLQYYDNNIKNKIITTLSGRNINKNDFNFVRKLIQDDKVKRLVVNYLSKVVNNISSLSSLSNKHKKYILILDSFPAYILSRVF